MKFAIPSAFQSVEQNSNNPVAPVWFTFFHNLWDAVAGGTTGLGSYAYISASQIEDSLGVDVPLNNTALYIDGPSVAQGTVGTWFASGGVTVGDTSSAATFFAKLWDGTTIIASRPIWVVGGAVSSVELSGVIANPAGDIRISVRDVTTVNGHIYANATGNGKDSTLSAFRIG